MHFNFTFRNTCRAVKNNKIKELKKMIDTLFDLFKCLILAELFITIPICLSYKIFNLN